MDMKFVDSVSGVKLRKTNDGYLVGEANCARTGIQTYTSKEMGLPGLTRPINVYRPADAVFHKDSLSTYAGKPVTLHHPTVPVTAENWKDYAIGQVGETVARDGEMVRVQFALMDAKGIEAVESGTREISMGYTTPIEMRDGVTEDGQAYQAVQTGPIRINHLAIVPKARGGDRLRVEDGAASWGAQPFTDNQHKGTTPMHKLIIDGLSVEFSDQGREAVVKLQGQISDAQTLIATKDAELAQKDTLLAQKDTLISTKDKEIADAKNAIPTGPALDALVADRQVVLAVAKVIDAEMKVDGLSNSDIRKAIVRKSLGDAKVDASLKDKSEAYVDAFYDANFDVVAAGAKSTLDMADSIHSNVFTLGDAGKRGSEKEEEEAFNKTTDRFNRKKK